MTNIKWYTAAALVALITASGAAYAHGNVADSGHMHKHCDFRKDKAAFEKMHALQKKLHDVVVADKFDKKAFISLSNQMEQMHSQMAKRHAAMFADKLAGMSQEERENLAEKFHEHMMMGPHGNAGWGGHGDDNGHWSHDAEENNGNYGREIPNH